LTKIHAKSTSQTLTIGSFLFLSDTGVPIADSDSEMTLLSFFSLIFFFIAAMPVLISADSGKSFVPGREAGGETGQTNGRTAKGRSGSDT
jgi:hypothetical protein